jgi:hypothetical protein
MRVVELLVVGAAVALLLVARLMAVRGFAQRHGSYAWLLFLPQLLIAAAIVYVALETIPQSLGVGLMLGLIGGVLGAVFVRLARTTQRAVSEAPTVDVGLQRTLEAFDKSILELTGFGLLAALVGLIGLIVWAVLGRGG